MTKQEFIGELKEILEAENLTEDRKLSGVEIQRVGTVRDLIGLIGNEKFTL